MSSLKTLAKDIRALPGKERRKNLIGLLGRMQQEIDKASATLAETSDAAIHAQDLVGLRVISTVRDNRIKAARQASRLRQLLDNFDNVVMDGPADKAVSRIVECASKSRTVVRDQWRATIEQLSRGYDALAVAAEQAHLLGRDDMRKAVSRFAAAAVQPPATAAAALKVRADQDAVKAAIERLGIQGIVGVFLIAASQGCGDPRHLLQREVATFLDANPDLWQLLRVKLA
jgi:hypothetical protein